MKKNNSNDLKTEILKEIAVLYRNPPEKGGFIIWCKKMAIQYDRLSMTYLDDVK